jgi:hypothetical protein
LEIVSLRNLILHEDVESYRVEKIMRRLETDRFLRNPPIVGRSTSDRHLIVLDGASRVTAARRLGYPHLLVQVVDYPSPNIRLETWHHLVVGTSLESLVDKASHIHGIEAERLPWAQAARQLEQRSSIACLRSPRRKPAVLRLARPRKTGLRPIREFTRLYATDPGLHRVREDQVTVPEEWLGEERVLVLFPRFQQEEIVGFALHRKDRLPMGITRHAVSNRALRVSYPVNQLQSLKSLEEKRRYLRRFLERKWEKGKIRHYPETTTLYDE